MTNVLRVVGPPGSGKTLLIISLVEALRARDWRVGTVVRREAIETAIFDSEVSRQLDAGAASTVIILANGGRVTLERIMPLPSLSAVIASLDPGIDLLLAEGFEDSGYPAIELLTSEDQPTTITDPDLLAVVSAQEFAGTFATFGPGETNGLADMIEREILDAEPDVSMEITIDDQPIAAMGFVKDMIAKPILVMVEQLKGVELPQSIRLNIRRRRNK